MSSGIDVRSGEPSYGRLLTAMYLGLAYDTMQRLPLVESSALIGRKRKAASDHDVGSRKRRRAVASGDKVTLAGIMS